MTDHARYEEGIGAYLLGALDESEAGDFERHLEGCERCRMDLQRLRPAADALPRTVAPVEPPPSLKRSLLEVVEREARERSGGPAVRPRRRRLLDLLPRGPQLAWAAAAVAVLVFVGGFGLAKFVSGGTEERTLSAQVDRNRVPRASGVLDVRDGTGVLRVHGLPPLGPGRTYQAWVQRDGEVIPQAVFGVRADGNGETALAANLSGAKAVMVTRERQAGARAPSERPILTIRL